MKIQKRILYIFIITIILILQNEQVSSYSKKTSSVKNINEANNVNSQEMINIENSTDSQEIIRVSNNINSQKIINVANISNQKEESKMADEIASNQKEESTMTDEIISSQKEESTMTDEIISSQKEESTMIDEIISNQENTFGINSFIENSKKYTGDFFENIDIKEMLNSAIQGKVDNSKIYKKVLNLFGKEISGTLKTCVSILIIIIIHSVLKSIAESLNNDNISKMIYYVQYIAIVTIIMNDFSSIINLVKETTNNLVGFMNTLIPILISLMIYTGNFSTSGVLEPIILFMINFIGNIIQDILIPVVLIVATITIVSKISDRIQVDKIAKFMKSSTVWFLGICLTVFVGVISLEGSLASSVDGVTAKTAKAIVSSAVPVVGKILGDAVDSILGCTVILKNAVGFVGVVIIIGICIMPILKLTAIIISYKILGCACQLIADKKIVDLVDEISDIFKILLAILISISVMIIIGITLILKISSQFTTI